MAYSENGIADLTYPVSQLHGRGWAVVYDCLEPDLYRDALTEATAALDISDSDTQLGIGYLALSPIDTPVNWHVANALAFSLGLSMSAHGYKRSLNYTAATNTSHLAYRRPGFKMDSHKDDAEIGAVVSLSLLSGRGNAIHIEQETGIKNIKLIGNKAVLLAGNDFGNYPTPSHCVPYTKSPRISILLSHHDPALWS